ncbi:bifunctional DNA primase/polymerase [Brucella pseudogrignonensis]|nr:bifunctional DNA primase/polymerase [Brucella pseudogrignonensis]
MPVSASLPKAIEHDPMLDVALYYHEKGIPVFPCRACEGEEFDRRTGEFISIGAKTPLTSNGFKGATLNERIVRGFWERNPSAIVGIPTGEKLGAWVLDVDMHQDEHGNTIDGFAALSALEQKYGPLPKTATVRTAGGGEHRYFSHVAGVRNRGALGAGLDVRGDGGYVIAAGSVLSDGRSYTWVDHDGDGLPDIADAPDWLLELVLPRSYESAYTAPQSISGQINDRYVERAVELELAETASISMGAGRNKGLNRAAFSLGTFVGAGALDESEAYALLQDVARSWGRDIPKSFQTIKNGINAGKLNPRHIPEATVHNNDNTPLMDTSRLIANHLAKKASSVAITEEVVCGDLPFIIPAVWYGLPVPEREWWLDGLVPMRQVTILNGDGGVGKSLLALQLAAAGSMGCETLDMCPMHGRVLYLGAEDEAAEFHRRLVDITKAHNRVLSDLENFKLLPMADADALLSIPNVKTGIMEPTPLWNAFAAEARVFRPVLITLDTAADLFGGDEVKRAQVRQFVSMLRKLAIEISCAIILLAHPSVAGMQNGTGSSGSTAWNNSVRSRLYLTRPDTKDDPDPDARVLKTMKTNYGKVGGEIKIRWEEGAFMLDDGKPSPAAGILHAHQEQTFLRLLSEINRTGQRVSASRSSTYAPTVMEGMPNAEGVDKKGFEAAMKRLFASDQIRVVMEGPQSKSRQRLVVIADEVAAKRMQAE